MLSQHNNQINAWINKFILIFFLFVLFKLFLKLCPSFLNWSIAPNKIFKITQGVNASRFYIDQNLLFSKTFLWSRFSTRIIPQPSLPPHKQINSRVYQINLILFSRAYFYASFALSHNIFSLMSITFHLSRSNKKAKENSQAVPVKWKGKDKVK